MSDYEIPMRKAAKEVWPNVETPGCAFHYRQTIRRSYMKRVLPKPPKMTPEAAAHAVIRRMVMNMQFLPAHLIIPAARFVVQYQTQHGVLIAFDGFNNYYFRYWLRTITPENFTMYRREHRTNNICESFNSRLNQNAGKAPSIYKLLLCMTLMTIESNQKRDDDYKVCSAMSRNLELAWDALDQGRLTVENFIRLNFFDPHLQI